jgi:hypothetical protein
MSLKDADPRGCASPRQSTTGACLAMGVAALFALGCQKTEAPAAEPGNKASAAGDSPAMPPAPSGDKVHCLGVHECKGKSECHVAGGHACVGQNDCKGKGWISLPKSECLKKGGTVLDS